MGILELIIVILLILWLFGYFGRGRFYGNRAGSTVVSDGGWLGGGNWVHVLLVIVVILIVLRLLGIV